MKPVDPRALPLLAPARLSLAGVVAAGALQGALVIAQAFVLAALVTGLVTDPTGDGWHTAAWWLLVVTAGRAVAQALSDLAAARAAGRVTVALRQRVLEAAFALSAARFGRRRSGELGLLATRGVAAVEPYLTSFLPTLVLAAVLPPATVVAIVWLDLWAGLIVLATLPLVPVFAVLIGLATRDQADRQYRTLSVLAGHFLDVVRGLPTLVTHNRAGVQSRTIREVTDRYRRATLATLRTAFASSGALELVATLSVALVAVSVGLRLASGGIGFETALAVLLLAPEAYWPLRRVGAEFHAAAEGAATLTTVTELLDEAAESADDDLTPEHFLAPCDAPERLVVDDLVVTHPGATSPALVLPHAEVPAGGLTAVVGPSGSGKSTLLATLLGELAPDRGAITRGGRAHLPHAWRRLVAQVPQVPWLLPGSVAANLRVARPDATDDELWAALREVDLAATVAALPGGLDAPLGEDGAGLSAGQRARLALARVVLADRPYVVLDEPTAHLDARTEEVLLRTLRRLARRATVLVVAHRRAVIAAADHVIALPAPAGRDAGAADPGPADPALHTALATVPRSSVAARSDERVDHPHDAPPTPRRARTRFALATTLATLASLSGVALTATAGWLIARSAERPPVLMLMVAIVGVRTFGLARPALRYAERLVSHDVALRLLAETRARVYDALVPLVPARLGRRRGDLLASVVDDVDAELDHRLRVLLPVRSWIAASVVTVGFVLWLLPLAALPVGVLALGLGALVLLLTRWGAARAERRFTLLRAQLSAEVVTALQSARQLVLWGRTSMATATVRRTGTAISRALLSAAAAIAAARAVAVLGAGAAVAATAAIAAGPVARGELSGPMAALLVLVPLAFADVLTPLPDAAATSVRTAAARQRLADLTDLEPAVTEPADPRPLAGPASVDLDGVSVGWDDRPVLEQVDLALPTGRRVGVVGGSGGGKSTLAALLVRHLAPTAGSYRLGGVDTTDLGSAEVRQHVGLVDDDPYVFASSVRENLRLARPDADDTALVEALVAAGLEAWVQALPHGLDTLLGDGGAGLSGGERARLGIARALLADPEVLVLDEPTAHLDAATAHAVGRTVLDRFTDRSLVWITHDGVALDLLDAVLRVEGGRVSLERAASRASRGHRTDVLPDRPHRALPGRGAGSLAS